MREEEEERIMKHSPVSSCFSSWGGWREEVPPLGCTGAA